MDIISIIHLLLPASRRVINSLAIERLFRRKKCGSAGVHKAILKNFGTPFYKTMFHHVVSFMTRIIQALSQVFFGFGC